MRVLITGGAGFIGSHLADELLREGHQVRVLDSLEPQVHGDTVAWPDYLSARVDHMFGDVCDGAQVSRAMRDVEAVYHFAAAVGVGQSMYRVTDYTRANNLGTAVLLETVLKHRIKRLIVASSMSVYGEGLYRDRRGQLVETAQRKPDDLQAGIWEPIDGEGHALEPVATPEGKPLDVRSVYALSKLDQERMCLLVGQTYGIPTTALRFFNAYGPRQALSNPYTGVLAIFGARLLNNRAPLVFEDGLQQRDFVHVRDVARACRLALHCDAAAGEVFNIGSGWPVTIRGLAEQLARVMRKSIVPEISGQFRAGDIRHCFADIGKATRVLDFRPEINLEDGMAELADWLRTQVAEDRVAQARQELTERGLTK